jgi:hypothetical protein
VTLTTTFAKPATAIAIAVTAKTRQTALTSFRSLTFKAGGTIYLRLTWVTVRCFGTLTDYRADCNRPGAAQQGLEE